MVGSTFLLAKLVDIYHRNVHWQNYDYCFINYGDIKHFQTLEKKEKRIIEKLLKNIACMVPPAVSFMGNTVFTLHCLHGFNMILWAYAREACLIVHLEWPFVRVPLIYSLNLNLVLSQHAEVNIQRIIPKNQVSICTNRGIAPIKHSSFKSSLCTIPFLTSPSRAPDCAVRRCVIRAYLRYF